jgi:hypothetical protein
MVFASPPLPAKRIIEVRPSKRSKRGDIGRAAQKEGAKRVGPVDTRLNGGISGGLDAVLESRDYYANEVHFGAEVVGFVVRNRVDADLGQPKRVQKPRRAAQYHVCPRKVDLQPGARIGVLRRQLGRKPDQRAQLGLLVQIAGRLLDGVDRLGCIAGQEQVIDGLAEHLVFQKPLCGSAVQLGYAIFFVALEALQKVFGEQVVVLKPRSFGVGPAEKQITLFDLFQDVSTAPVVGERGGQSAADLFGDAGRQQEIE